MLDILLYMVLYQLDEIIIFLVVTVTMKSRKLGQEEGRVIKLFSGLLMVTLSVVMIVNPAMMNNIGTTLLVFALALIMTLIILLLTSVILPKFGIYIGHVKEPEAAKEPRDAKKSQKTEEPEPAKESQDVNESQKEQEPEPAQESQDVNESREAQEPEEKSDK